jgi:uncharacterized protein YuzE
MNVRYDQEANALYIRFRDGDITESDEIRDGVIVDFDSTGKPIGIEILNANEILAGKPEIAVNLSNFIHPNIHPSI